MSKHPHYAALCSVSIYKDHPDGKAKPSIQLSLKDYNIEAENELTNANEDPQWSFAFNQSDARFIALQIIYKLADEGDEIAKEFRKAMQTILAAKRLERDAKALITKELGKIMETLSAAKDTKALAEEPKTPEEPR